MSQTPEEPAPGTTPSRIGATLAPLNTNTSGETTRPVDSNPTTPLSPSQRPVSSGFLAVPNSSQARASSETPQTPSSLGGDTLANTGSVSGNADGPSEEDPLRPDPNNEHEFTVENNVFAFTPGQLGKLYNPKSLAAFKALGGLAGIEAGLRTNRETGLSLDEEHLENVVTFDQAIAASHAPRETGRPGFNAPARATTSVQTSGESNRYADRQRVFKDNRLPEKKAKSIFELMWIAFNDKILILLSIAAAVSLALGLYQTFGQSHGPGEPKVDWVEGVAIMVAIVIVVMVGAGNDWQKERQFVKLNKKKEDRTVKVIRSGRSLQISVYDVLVGDVVHMEPGDLVPVDGIFISGHNVKCDESSATGESDQMRKTPADEVWRRMEAGENMTKLDPFILSGSKVLEGVGTFLVTATGVHSSYGKIMMAMREETDATPLQMKLNGLAEAIAKLGGASALLLFVVLFIRFVIGLTGKFKHDSASHKGQSFMRILITTITVVVVAVPEGLPLAVTLALAFATTRMLKDNNLVRVLRACETMGNATTVCSDKTGTLTQNRMTVVAGTLGVSSSFGSDWESPEREDEKVEEKPRYEGPLPTITMVRTFIDSLSGEVKEILLRSIVLNSTAFEGIDNGVEGFIGSKTETALLGFAREHLGMGPVAIERANAEVEQMVPFDSGRKCMAIVVKTANGYRMYVKGASEILLDQCSRIITSATEGLNDTRLTSEDIDAVNEIILQYARRSLRTIGLVYRDFPSWPPPGARVLKEDTTKAEFTDVFNDMVFLGIVGIQDPLREGVVDAVADCQRAGVVVRMVTGDNIETAKAIAKQCGILQQGGVVMEGPKFRQLNPWEMDQIIPRLMVLARSSPEDKRILVKKLKELGETVAVTGDGTNDGPALKTADVGFSMGIAGTEVAKEASSIILMDDNFASIVKAIMWGRAVNDAVKKFLQFQLTVNITAVLTTFVTAVASDREQSVLRAVQLLWINLIMDTLAALALATDPPTRAILNRKPDSKSAPLITVNMWKMILGQAVYQLIVSFVLHFAGPSFLNYPPSDDPDDYRMSALVFNTFVWLQIFNQYNNRRLDNKFNVFEGITHNWFFIGINLIMIGGQVMIIFIGGQAFHVRELSPRDWGISLILGALSLPVAVIIRLIPDEAFGKLLPRRMREKQKPANIYVTTDRFEWSQPLVEIREELAFLKRVRGGRLNQLKFRTNRFREHFTAGIRPSAPPSPSMEMFPYGTQPPASSGSSHSHRRRSRSNSTYTVAAMVPSIVAGSVAGWSPIDKADADSMKFPLPAKKADSEAGIEGGRDEGKGEKTLKP